MDNQKVPGKYLPPPLPFQPIVTATLLAISVLDSFVVYTSCGREYVEQLHHVLSVP